MERWSGRVALVTGASAGIGYAISKALAQHGLVVVGVARNIEKIQELTDELKKRGAKGRLVAMKCDVTKDEEVLNVFAKIRQDLGGVDVCINNAGMSHNKNLLEGTPEQWREMLDVNVVALCLCTKESVKSMRERKVDDGQIINISSVCGHFIYKDYDVEHFYTATKFAVQALTEGLRQELRQAKSHIRVCAIAPALVDTEFADRMTGVPGTQKALKESIGAPLQGEDLAAAVMHVLAAPPHVDINDMIIHQTFGNL